MFNLDLLTLKLAILSGLLGLDGSAAMQMMLSRPLVVGLLTGWLCGDAVAGLSVGCIMELLCSANLPVGAYVPPDYQLAAAVTVAGTLRIAPSGVAASGRVPFEAVLVAMLLVGLGLAWVGGHIDIWLRRLNVGLCHYSEEGVSRGRFGALGRALAAALALSFLKTALLVVLGVGIVAPVLGRLLQDQPWPVLQGLARMSWLLLALGLAVVVDLFWERRLTPALVGSFGASWLLIHLVKVPLLWMVPISLAAGAAVAVVWRPRNA